MVVAGNSRPRSIISKAKPGEIEGRPVGPDAGEALAAPILRHGIQANCKTLEMAAQMSNEQGLTPRCMTLEELFAPTVMDR